MAGSSSPPVDAGARRRGEAARLGAVSLGLVLGAAACGDELKVDVRYEVVGLSPAVAGACGAVPRAPPDAVGATKVRFTFRDHTANGLGGPLRCDLVIPRATASPVIAVPRRGEPVDLWVEYFADDGSLVARASRSNVDLTRGTVTLYASPPESYACAPAQPSQVRAFHSATRLPSGEVLLLGGLVGAPTDGAAPFLPNAGGYVTSSAEIYDPVTSRVFPVTIPGLAPRAFHDVIVLGTSGDRVQLVVSGGVGVAGNPAALGNVAATGGSIGAAPWRVVEASAATMRAGSVAPAPELLTYTPATHAFERTALIGVPGHVFGSNVVEDVRFGAPPVVAGGSGGVDAIVLSSAGTITATLTGLARIGGSIVALSDTTSIWIAGDLTSTRAYDVIDATTGAEALIVGPATPTSPRRAFGAAARVGTTIYYLGGLQIAAGEIVDATPAPAGYVVDPVALTTEALDTPLLTSAAYLAAAQLPGGDVLVSGGAIAGRVECLGTLACVSAQSVRLGPGTAVEVGTPGVSRYGHRLTRLRDGTVLVSGGFTAAADGQIRALATLERFEPHRAVDDPLADLAIVRAPGEVAMAAGVPVAPCTLVTGATADGAVSDAAPAQDDALEPDAVEPDAP